MPKFVTLSVGLSAIVFAVLIPVLELNSTHLTNPEWPSHARLHEAWQLLTNAAISVLALGCVWTNRAPRIGISLALMIGVSFLTAWALGSIYGGSMLHTDGTQMAVGGINVAVIVVIALTALLLASLWKIKVFNLSQKQGI
ncbi:Uncharacterised protein [Halioglobus japonicus]|nr:Uncharacterised protein [Halioglobus japonicus]